MERLRLFLLPTMSFKNSLQNVSAIEVLFKVKRIIFCSDRHCGHFLWYKQLSCFVIFQITCIGTSSHCECQQHIYHSRDCTPEHIKANICKWDCSPNQTRVLSVINSSYSVKCPILDYFLNGLVIHFNSLLHLM